MNGYGREILGDSNSVYTGQFKNGKKNGKGKLICIIYLNDGFPGKVNECPDGKEYENGKGII